MKPAFLKMLVCDSENTVTSGMFSAFALILSDAQGVLPFNTFVSPVQMSTQ